MFIIKLTYKTELEKIDCFLNEQHELETSLLLDDKLQKLVASC